MSDTLTPDDIQQTIDSMSLIVRLVMFSQMGFGWACLLASIVTYSIQGDYVLVLAFAIIAATLPFIARVAVFELQRTILDYRRHLPDAQSTSLDEMFSQMRSERRLWIRGLGGAFLLSVVLGVAAVVLSDSAIVLLPTVLLWALAGAALTFFTRSALVVRQQ